MSSRWQWVLHLVTRRIWFRAALFSLFSVVLALLAAGIAPIIPYDISTKIGSKAVDNILGIIASSMLAVTTFSLTAMVSAFSGASSTITPRATELLVQDATAQNALSTFLGAFLFAIVGICALSTGLYGETGRVILFAGTIFVIVVIVVTLLRWIEHLSRFGRVADTIARVERAARAAAAASRLHVCLQPAVQQRTSPGGDAARIRGDKIGYVTHVDLGALTEHAARTGQRVHISAMPGAFVTPQHLLAWQQADPECAGNILKAFTISHERQFDQDPRFALVVLAEIASRALSPGINDPGTAIAVLGAGMRVLVATIEQSGDRTSRESDGLDLPPLRFGDLLEDLFRPIARDGANVVEVAIKLQRTLGELALIAPEAAPSLHSHAADALTRAERGIDSEADLAQLRAVYDRHWKANGTSVEAASGESQSHGRSIA